MRTEEALRAAQRAGDMTRVSQIMGRIDPPRISRVDMLTPLKDQDYRDLRKCACVRHDIPEGNPTGWQCSNLHYGEHVRFREDIKGKARRLRRLRNGYVGCNCGENPCN